MIRELQWKMLDNFRRKLFLKYELHRIVLKSVTKNTYLPWINRYFAFYNKSKLLQLSSITKQKNRCIRSGRRWSIVKMTSYSRFVFRNESYNGNLPGFRRASW
jgi:small subunit ribosomal protein S14